ncbi:ribbon-helix-helix domain-containing protein [Ligilactobacillus agilis]|uniref:ribbon-helix-helix domain-containing protein n=1 Tax=Ligilactobacillus agilis TaxID=1601 RepID=UPI0011EA69F5|nr:ribbon-helix-helix domain-containing protein [Ligilactobacillus agilis]
MVTSKKRTQISLNDEVYKILEGISKEMGISKSAVVAMLLVKEKNKQNAKK